MPDTDTDDWTWEDEPPRPEPLRLRWLLGGLLLAGMFALGWWYSTRVGNYATLEDRLRHELYPQVWREEAPSSQQIFSDPRASHTVLYNSNTEEGIMQGVQPWLWNTPLLLDPEASTTFRETYTFHNIRLENDWHDPRTPGYAPFRESGEATPAGSLTLREVDQLRTACHQAQAGAVIDVRRLPPALRLEENRGFMALCQMLTASEQPMTETEHLLAPGGGAP